MGLTIPYGSDFSARPAQRDAAPSHSAACALRPRSRMGPVRCKAIRWGWGGCKSKRCACRGKWPTGRAGCLRTTTACTARCWGGMFNPIPSGWRGGVGRLTVMWMGIRYRSLILGASSRCLVGGRTRGGQRLRLEIASPLNVLLACARRPQRTGIKPKSTVPSASLFVGPQRCWSTLPTWHRGGEVSPRSPQHKVLLATGPASWCAGQHGLALQVRSA